MNRTHYMRYVVVTMGLLCTVSLLAEEDLLVLVLMVKNEAHVMERTLQPLVDGGITSFFIFDTGSTDTTVAVTRNFFEKNSIEKYAIVEEPFVNFSYSRNRALELSEAAFPSAHFILMIDAEWLVHGVDRLLIFCAEHASDYDPLYLIRVVNWCDTFYHPRLIRTHQHVRFVGGVHEVPNIISTAKVADAIYIERTVTALGIEQSRRRWQRDAGILMAEHTQDPSNARTLFYLAQTFDCLNDLVNARVWYGKRISVLGWPEETFMASYRLAQVLERLAVTGECSWDEAHAEYLRAFSMRPTRAEPLVLLAEHYWSVGNYPLCYLFAHAAAQIPYPQEDYFLVNHAFYDYYRYDLLGRAAWYLGKYVEGEAAVRQALMVRPDLEHLHNNLALYVARH
jgi:hypothetical protein